MKLKTGFLKRQIDNALFLVPVGAESFHGIVRGNATAAAIVDLLETETTEESIVDALYAKYDAPREKIAADVRTILDTLRKVNALEE